ncbi:hypothetical protein DSTSK_02220 [Desulforhabdus sp. TSK]|nr:hypothetical protein DSTSK_02220 [Desulforhabdus sp. TSK]
MPPKINWKDKKKAVGLGGGVTFVMLYASIVLNIILNT